MGGNVDVYGTSGKPRKGGKKPVYLMKLGCDYKVKLFCEDIVWTC